jgi:xyloglucan:xyloglucosyl transferase
MVKTLKSFIFGSISTRIMLIKGNSAGSVTTYYVREPNYSSTDYFFFESCM